MGQETEGAEAVVYGDHDGAVPGQPAAVVKGQAVVEL
jgi:hypothetical protein